VQSWLSKNGLVTWLANDVFHAIEELSDFTVRDRPDVVLLEVAFLAEAFDAVRSALKMSSGEENVKVLGLADGPAPDDKCFAKDLNQLRSLMDSGRGVAGRAGAA